MKKILFQFKDTSFWFDMCTMYILLTIMSLLNVPWNIAAFCALISVIVLIIFCIKDKYSYKEIDDLNRKLKKAIKKARKTFDFMELYKTLNEVLLPNMKKQLPQKIYKYYQLGNNEDNDKRRIDNVKNNLIWSSISSEFNDPFEFQYMYLTEEDIVAMGLPKESKKIWDSIMETIQQHITTICFTQNPNNLPMWAHYANEHKGFCVEYEIIDNSNFLPVLYVKNRLKTQGLFVQLINILFDNNNESVNAVLKFIMLLSSFKDESWSSEREVRAIFMNSKEVMSTKGKICSCKEIGVLPTKIFIGAKCSKENTELLTSIANEMNVSFEKCSLSTNNDFSVIAGSYGT